MSYEWLIPLSFGASCPSHVPSQLLVHPQPTARVVQDAEKALTLCKQILFSAQTQTISSLILPFLKKTTPAKASTIVNAQSIEF